MTEHTRTPWKVDKWLGSSNWLVAYDAGSSGRGIAIAETVPSTGKELDNAKHIVHCVNNHDRLVEALRHSLEFVEMHSNRYDGFSTEHPQTLAEEARTLLAELENQQ